MAFDYVTQLLVDGVWTDVTDVGGGVRYEPNITVERSSLGYLSKGDPTKVTLNLDNRDGTYSPKNLLSPLYGMLGRNTKLRVAYRPNRGSYTDVTDTFSRTASSGWGTADSGHLWSFTGFGTVTAADWDVTGGVGRHKVGAANAWRLSYIPLSIEDVDITTTFTAPSVSGGSVDVNLIFRGIDDVSPLLTVRLNTDHSVTVQFTTRESVNLGSATVSGLTHSGQALRARAYATGDRWYGKVWAAAGAEPDDWDLAVVDTTGEPVVPGWAGIETVVNSGNTNPKPLTVTYDNVSMVQELPRAVVEVPQWPQSWDPSETDIVTQVEGYGPLYAMQQATKPARSCLYRYTLHNEPDFYWPMEDGQDSVSAASAVDGVGPLVAYQAVATITPGLLAFGQGKGSGGSAPILDLASGGSLTAIVPDNGNFTDHWSIDWVARFPLNGQDDDGGNPGTMLTWTTASSGTNLDQFTVDAGFTWRLFYGDASANQGRAIATGSSLPNPYTDGQPHHYRVTAEQHGSDVTISLYYDGVLVGLGGDFSDDGEPTATLGRITEVRVNDSTPDGGDWMPSIGHVTIWYGDTPSSGGTAADAAAGFPGEWSTSRFRRLCREDSVAYQVDEPLTGPRTLMGPQQVGRFIDLLDAVRSTERGYIYELRGSFALGFCTRPLLYNQDAALELDYDAGHFTSMPRPDNTFEIVSNDVTVSAIGGTSGRAVDTDGPLGTDAIGPRDIGIDINSYDADYPRQVAGWILAQATETDEMFPSLAVTLTADTDDTMFEQAITADVTNAMTVDNLPVWVGSNSRNLLLVATQETLGRYLWDLNYSTIPGNVYQVLVLDDPVRSKLDSDASSLVSAIASSDTTFSVITESGHSAWTTTDAEFGADGPLDVTVRDERIRVTDIAHVLNDAFGRTTSNGWGNSDSGTAWTTSGGSASDYSVSGGTGRQSNGTVGTLRNALNDIGSVDCDVAVQFILPVTTAATAAISTWLVGRATDTSNYYAVRADLFTSGIMVLGLYKRVAGTLTQIVSNANVSANTAGDVWELSLKIHGSTIYGDCRNTTTGAKRVAQQVTDTSLTTGTKVGLLSRLETGNTNTTPVVWQFDNLSVTNPKKFTVVRPAISAAHPAGTAVHVWHPARVAL